MKIAPGKPLPGLDTYWTVTVAPGELITASGEAFTRGGRIGTIRGTGLIEVSYPGVVPVGYKAAAEVILEKAKAQLGFSRHGNKTVRRRHRY